MARRIHFWCLVIVLGLAPLPFGAYRPWAGALLAVLLGLLCLVWPAVVWRSTDLPAASPRRIAVPALGFAAVLAWAALQTTPWLPDWLSHPLWREAAAGLGEALPGRVSIDPLAGRAGIAHLLAVAAAFWLAFQHAHSRRRAHSLVEALALIGGVYAAYGLAAHFSGSDTILFWRKWFYRDDLTSTFVNRNSYATYAGLGLLCAFAALHHRVRSWRSLRALVLHLRRRTAIFAGAALLILPALLATGSRAGTAATALGIFALIVGTVLTAPAAVGAAPWRRPAILGGALLGLAVLGVLASVSGVLHTEFGDRQRIYGIALGAVAQHPWTGSGLGSFAGIFAMERPITVSQVWTEAHDTYIELALELGIPAAAVLVSAVLWLVGLCVAAIAARRDTIYPALGIAATALVGSHALLDFSLQIPAIAVTWAALLGTGVAQARPFVPLASPR